MVILGKQAIDGDNCQTSAMTAALLGWPQGTFAAAVSVNAGKTEVTLDRETENGSEKLTVPLPAVISADLRLNEPRYPTLPNIMKARKKPLDTITVESLSIDIKPRNTVVKVEDPPSRKAGIVVDGVDTLINKLKNESAVI